MIHLVNSKNRHQYTSELDQHFRMRHDIYVDERHWENLRSPDRYERDQFDNDDASYLLAINDGHVVGGSRFVPTDKPHLLSEIFPHTANVRGVPQASDIAEWTRFFAAAPLRETWRNGGTVAQIVCGTVEYLLDEGYSAFTFLIECWFLGRITDMGWRLMPLGLPEMIEGSWWIAAKVPIDADALASTRRFCGISGSVLANNSSRDSSWRRSV